MRGSTQTRETATYPSVQAGYGRRWGLVLAGGDGIRLRTLTRLICGDDRPKQFCPLLDENTLLNHAVRRTERSIPSAQILFALTCTHRDFYADDLNDFEPQRIVQPANKGTAPPILFSALSIERMDDSALIAILPGGHYYSDEARFTAALEAAFEIAAKRPGKVVLIGAQPSRPEVECGWIALGAPVGSESGELYRVRGFEEKTTRDAARALLGGQSAWNTFVMVGHVSAILGMAARATPYLLEGVRRAELWAGAETYIGESVYDKLVSSDYSKQVLSPEALRLLVLRVRDLGWSDLGDPGRVMDVLQESASKPRWWTKELRMRMAAVTAAQTGDTQTGDADALAATA